MRRMEKQFGGSEIHDLVALKIKVKFGAAIYDD